MRLSPPQRTIVLVLGRVPGRHLRLRDVAALVERSNSTVYPQLRRLVRLGLVVKDPAGWRIAEDVSVSRKGIVYRQLWMFRDEAAA